MKRLLLLPYLFTSLVGYTQFVFDPQLYRSQLNYELFVSWYVITILGLVVALAAKEW
jgi:hypothetical protein